MFAMFSKRLIAISASPDLSPNHSLLSLLIPALIFIAFFQHRFTLIGSVCILRTLKYLWGRIYWDMGNFKLLAQFIRTTSNYKLWQNSHFTKRQLSFYYTADGFGIYILLYIIHSNTQKR